MAFTLVLKFSHNWALKGLKRWRKQKCQVMWTLKRDPSIKKVLSGKTWMSTVHFHPKLSIQPRQTLSISRWQKLWHPENKTKTISPAEAFSTTTRNTPPSTPSQSLPSNLSMQAQTTRSNSSTRQSTAKGHTARHRNRWNNHHRLWVS